MYKLLQAKVTTYLCLRYKGSRSTEPSFDSMLFDGNRDHLNCSSDLTNKNNKGTSIWADTSSKSGSGWDDSSKSGSGWVDKSNSWGDMDKSTSGVKKGKAEWGEPERRQPKSNVDDKKSSSAAGNEAQKKFGSAKAISSDQYFSDFASDSVMVNMLIFFLFSTSFNFAYS